MFDFEAFIEDCRRLVGEPHAPRRVLERMREAVSDPEALAKAVPPLPPNAGTFDAPLFRSPELTVLNVTLRPGALSAPHDHHMWAVIGIYGGAETNTFYRRDGERLVEANRRTVPAGEALLLGDDVIHTVENPLQTPTLGLHVYGGDLLGAARSMWDPTDGREVSYDIPQFMQWGRELAEARNAKRAPASQPAPVRVVRDLDPKV
jgi:predicted metal-dependent enzyme (double-stranded beta helix superfamily)